MKKIKRERDTHARTQTSTTTTTKNEIWNNLIIENSARWLEYTYSVHIAGITIYTYSQTSGESFIEEQTKRWWTHKVIGWQFFVFGCFFGFHMCTCIGIIERSTSISFFGFHFFFITICCILSFILVWPFKPKKTSSLTMKINPFHVVVFVVGGSERTHFGNAMIFDTFSWLVELYFFFGDND